MTISTETSFINYIGNGVTTTFSFPFVGVSSSDLQVVYTDADGNEAILDPSTYTVVINPPASGSLWGVGGSITYPNVGSPIASGTALSIQRMVPYEQTISISNQGNFYPQAVEQGLDLLELQVQQVQAETEYSVRAPLTDNVPLNVLPSATQRVGKFLAFDSSGQPTVTSVAPPYEASISNGIISALQYMTTAEIADITSNTASIDVSVNLQQAIDAAYTNNWAVWFPGGTYLCKNIKSYDSVQLYGATNAVLKINTGATWGLSLLNNPTQTNPNTFIQNVFIENLSINMNGNGLFGILAQCVHSSYINAIVTNVPDTYGTYDDGGGEGAKTYAACGIALKGIYNTTLSQGFGADYNLLEQVRISPVNVSSDPTFGNPLINYINIGGHVINGGDAIVVTLTKYNGSSVITSGTGSYTVLNTDTPATIATSIASALQANSTLNGAGFTFTASSVSYTSGNYMGLISCTGNSNQFRQSTTSSTLQTYWIITFSITPGGSNAAFSPEEFLSVGTAAYCVGIYSNTSPGGSSGNANFNKFSQCVSKGFFNGIQLLNANDCTIDQLEGSNSTFAIYLGDYNRSIGVSRTSIYNTYSEHCNYGLFANTNCNDTHVYGWSSDANTITTIYDNGDYTVYTALPSSITGILYSSSSAATSTWLACNNMATLTTLGNHATIFAGKGHFTSSGPFLAAFGTQGGATSTGSTPYFDGATGNISATGLSPLYSPGNQTSLVVSGAFSVASNTTLAPIITGTTTTPTGGLYFNAQSGYSYRFTVALQVTADASGGFKVNMNGGTASFSSFIAQYSSGTLSGSGAPANSIVSSPVTAFNATGPTSILILITGTFTASSAGTVIPQFAQNASDSTASVVTVAGTYFNVQRIA